MEMKELYEFGEAVAARAEKIANEKGRAILLIDGRCASGKSTLGAYLAKRLGCNLFHMDDFFLPFRQKTAERLSEPGGNVDHERFLAEVLIPLAKGIPFSYRPFDCSTQALAAPVEVTPTPIAVVEGVYCCRPELIPHGDLTLFLTVDPEEQAARILARNGAAMARRFREEWIPLEEVYFRTYRVEEQCVMHYPLGNLDKDPPLGV